MGLFFTEAKKEAKAKTSRPARGTIPIASLNKLGCSVCPRDKDRELRSPKMGATGANNPSIYLLGTGPNEEEDDRGEHWQGVGGRAITSKFTRSFFERQVRSGHITQCMPQIGGPGHPGDHEIECCRGRVVEDIEASKPLVVVGVGDLPLHWATGLPRNALNFRGSLIAAKIGRHVCWYYPILYPNYTKGKQYKNKNEWELTLEHDIAYIEGLIDDKILIDPPRFYEAPYDKGIECITGQEQGDMMRLESALHRMLSLDHLGLDYETSALRPLMTKDPKIWTAAAGQFDHVVAFPVYHPDGWGTETRMNKVMGMLGEFILQSKRKRCHNLGFEQDWSAYSWGNQILRQTEWEDTMAMAYAFDSRQGIKSLDVQCRINFGFFLKAQSRVDVSRPNWITEFSLKEVLRYNGLDSKWTDKQADFYLPRLEAEPYARGVYEGRLRLAPTLVLTSARGLPVDFDYANDMVDDINKKLDVIEQKARRLPEMKQYATKFGTFSFTNPDHALKLMRDVLHRPEVERTDRDGKVSYTSDEEALASMPNDEVPSAAMILEHRQLTRCNSTYLLPLIEGRLTGPDNLIHAEYQSMVTVTSRLSSEMHNWPKHKHKEVRGVVAPPDGQWFVAADYGQIEFRVAGMLSEDQNLVKYCWTGYDVHKFWAERVVKAYGPVKDWIVKEFDVDWDEKGLKTLRQAMKNTWVFPQLFGATTRSCAARLHIPEDVADNLGTEFWDEFRGVKRWQEKVMAGYEKNLYVETLGGFRRRGPNTRNELINAPIQGTACEIVLEAQNAISERAQAEDIWELQPAFNGHDDLSFIISDANLERNIAIIAEEMCQHRFDYINCPLKVEVSVGPRWHELQELKVYSSADMFNLPNPYERQR